MAFHSMLEAVLRDGEDMAVMLGYATVRRYFKQWEHTLDNVVTPRLVAVDAGNELNTMVIRRKGPAQLGSRTRGQPDTNNYSHDPNDPNDSYDTDDTDDSRASNDTDDQDDEDAATNKPETEEHVHPIDVTGMKDWSNFVFGDPLFAAIFNNDPSEDFLAGFYSSATNQSPKRPDEPFHPKVSTSLVDDEETAPVRLLLYGCYHTITQIVKEFYRPQRDSSRRELAARKKLTQILAKLDQLTTEAEARSRATSSPPASSPTRQPPHTSPPQKEATL
jgi:hypothetical protein